MVMGGGVVGCGERRRWKGEGNEAAGRGFFGGGVLAREAWEGFSLVMCNPETQKSINVQQHYTEAVASRSIRPPPGRSQQKQILRVKVAGRQYAFLPNPPPSPTPPLNIASSASCTSRARSCDCALCNRSWLLNHQRTYKRHAHY